MTDQPIIQHLINVQCPHCTEHFKLYLSANVQVVTPEPVTAEVVPAPPKAKRPRKGTAK